MSATKTVVGKRIPIHVGRVRETEQDGVRHAQCGENIAPPWRIGLDAWRTCCSKDLWGAFGRLNCQKLFAANGSDKWVETERWIDLKEPFFGGWIQTRIVD